MPDGRDSSHYNVLGIGKDASLSQITAAYRTAVLKHHPDRSNAAKSSPEEFLRAQQAYEVLRNDSLRKVYDRQLDQRRVLGHIAPSDIIRREDLQQLGGDDVMTYSCRCGGSYIVDLADMQLYTEFLLPCDTCSQYVCLDTSQEEPSNG
ncbi:hypothetical protein WJX74_004437 [Apatococcus lobatus]|uniref:Diphthamide biosynthesis protein 4 n=1 Tax=Apatococcus lobatus TaxID=904363 RepID=A0AAW1QJR0_9CHLO